MRTAHFTCFKALSNQYSYHSFHILYAIEHIIKSIFAVDIIYVQQGNEWQHCANGIERERRLQ